MHKLLSQRQIDDFARDGAVVVPGLFAGFVELIAEGIEANMADPGPYAAENLKPGETGRFFDDYCNWTRLPPFQNVIANSPVGEVAADLMARGPPAVSRPCLVKAGTNKPTPWHQDSPYYFVEASRPSASGVRLIRWARRRSLCCRIIMSADTLAVRENFTPTGRLCRFPTRMPTVWKFSNGRCSPASRGLRFSRSPWCAGQ